MRRVIAALVLIGCQPPPAVAPEAGNAAPEQAAPTADADATPAEAEPGEKTADAKEVDQANLPAAEEVLAKSVEAIGGQAKIDTITSYYSETQLDIPAQNMSATTKVWWKGGFFYAETDMPALGVTKVWKTGAGLWSEDPVSGMREVSGKEARQTAWANALVLQAEWKDYFQTAKTTGRRKLDGKVVLDVELSSEAGDEITMTFDEATWLVVEQSFVQESPMGTMPITVRVDEYKDYDGFKSPAVSVMDMKVFKATQKVTKFEPNAEVDAAKLKPPKGKGKSKGGKKKAKKAKP